MVRDVWYRSLVRRCGRSSGLAGRIGIVLFIGLRIDASDCYGRHDMERGQSSHRSAHSNAENQRRDAVERSNQSNGSGARVATSNFLAGQYAARDWQVRRTD